jgi:hypothetical protein
MDAQLKAQRVSSAKRRLLPVSDTTSNKSSVKSQKPSDTSSV